MDQIWRSNRKRFKAEDNQINKGFCVVETVKKKTITMVSHPEKPNEFLKAEDLEYKIVEEGWSTYELEDGSRLKIKTVAGKISRCIDPETGEIYYDSSGEPLYNVRYHVNVIAEVNPELVKIPKGGKKREKSS